MLWMVLSDPQKKQAISKAYALVSEEIKLFECDVIFRPLFAIIENEIDDSGILSEIETY